VLAGRLIRQLGASALALASAFDGGRRVAGRTRAYNPSTVSEQPSVTVPAAQGPWSLVGRASEIAQVAAARADAACPGAVIIAAAGVGKSRVAREACMAAQAEGAVTLWAQATVCSAVIPLGALAGLIPGEVRSDDTLELIRRSTAALRTQAGDHEIVLAVDDAHLLDATSATLVLHLASGSDVFVLVTVRSGEPVPDAVESLWKDAGARRIDLAQFTDDAILQLVETGLDGPVEHATAQRVVEMSAGNPLYARELVLGALDQGTLALDHGLWRLRGRPSVPPSLTDLIRRRMGSIGDAEHRPLELLALGEPLSLDEVIALTSYEGLAAAEERGMVAISQAAGEAEVRLAHPLYGEVLREALPVLRARELRLRLAETIQRRQPVSPDDALRAARWLIDAGAQVPSVLLVDAAAAANLAGDPALGAELARRALDAGAGLDATLLLARAHTIRNRFEDAEAVLAAAEDTVPGDPAARKYLAQRVHVLFWGLRRSAEARAFLDRAQVWWSDPASARHLESWRVGLAGLTDGFAGRVESLEKMLADPGMKPNRRRSLEAVYAYALMSSGRAREADAVARRVRPTVPLRDNWDSYGLFAMRFVGLESGEDWEDLAAYMAAVLDEGVRVADHEAAGLAAFTLGSLAVERGRYRDAQRWLAEAEAQLEHHDTFATVSCVRALQVGIAYFTGDGAGALAVLDSLRAQIAGRDLLPAQHAHVLRAEGWAARVLSAAAGAQRFRDDAQAAEDPSVRSRLLYEAMRCGAGPANVARELVELTGRCDSRLVAARAAHALARVDRDGEALMDAGVLMATIGADVYALEAAVDAAREFIAQGRMDSARRAANVARGRYHPDHGGLFPVIDGLDGVAIELTGREAQIATLAARGLTNQEIADQLVLSVRTVETYVYRAMNKRGVANRHEL
jgi:DNA-binding CsgD family transcriptional regulator